MPSRFTAVPGSHGPRFSGSVNVEASVEVPASIFSLLDVNCCRLELERFAKVTLLGVLAPFISVCDTGGVRGVVSGLVVRTELGLTEESLFPGLTTDPSLSLFPLWELC